MEENVLKLNPLPLCTACGVISLPHKCEDGTVYLRKRSSTGVSVASPTVNPEHDVQSEQSDKYKAYCVRFALPPNKKTRVEEEPNKLGAGVDAVRGMLSEHDDRLTQMKMLKKELSSSDTTIAELRVALEQEKAAAALSTQAATKLADTEKTIEMQNKQLQDSAITIDKQTSELQTKAQQFKNADGELKKLAAELKKSAAELKKTSSELEKARKSAKKPIRELYSMLVNSVSTTYEEKGKWMQAAWVPPAPAPAPAPTAAPAVACVMILQKNAAPQYATVREVKWKPTAALDKAFYFDSSSTPWAPSWTKIADVTTTTSLLTLGTVNKKDKKGAVEKWTPLVGKTVQYKFGQHTYDVEVVQQPYPVQPVAAPPPPPPPPPPPQTVYKMPWEHQVLFTGSFHKIDPLYLLEDKYCAEYDFSALPKPSRMKDIKGVCTGGKEGLSVADAARVFSSFGQKFDYDPDKSQLWLKPPLFAAWLQIAKSRGYAECRMLMHGCRSGDYDKLAADPLGFDMALSRCGQKSFAFYASCSDHIASEYAQSSKMYPDGTAYIGLLLVKDKVAMAAYEPYYLGSCRPGSLPFVALCSDAIAIRDQSLWLPIGLAVAIAKPKGAASSS